MPEDEGAVVAPADSRVLTGSLSDVSRIFIKEKFFRFAELLGGKAPWVDLFQSGDFAIFRTRNQLRQMVTRATVSFHVYKDRV